MASQTRPLAVVTGASTGIGYALARCCAEHGFDLLVAADEPAINDAAAKFREHGATVDAVEADLSAIEGVDKLTAALNGRKVDALLANAGRGLGKGFLDQDFAAARKVVDTNITGTIYLIQKIGREMRAAGQGRILVTGSIAGFLPGTYQAVYNGTKAFLDSFSFALRHELKNTGVSVTCLMPGATETEFFERADMMDTKVGTAKKDDAAQVAETGFKAMMKGEGDVVTGWHNKLQTAIASVTPAGVLAEMHRGMAAPGPAKSEPAAVPAAGRAADTRRNQLPGGEAVCWLPATNHAKRPAVAPGMGERRRDPGSASDPSRRAAARTRVATDAGVAESMSDIADKIKKIVVEHLGVEESKVTPEASFIDDLGADSLDTVELVMAFEEAFSVEIPEDAAEKISTVKDAIDYIEKQKSA